MEDLKEVKREPFSSPGEKQSSQRKQKSKSSEWEAYVFEEQGDQCDRGKELLREYLKMEDWEEPMIESRLRW